ncbi:MAG: serine/threonine-protein kinase [Myxococcota bacterium]
MQLPAPFGKYELLERIATGGMAEVFLARSFGVAGFEKRLVIKRLRPELAEDPRFVSMFIAEAKIGVHLNHPNVVSVFELGKVGPAHYIAMEHLHGRDLTRIVKALRAREERVPLDRAVAIVAEVCRGLAYAHGRTDADGRPLGLVHRDVSPHNVLVTFAGEVKLVDFGIARLITTHTASGAPDRKPGPGGGKYAYIGRSRPRARTSTTAPTCSRPGSCCGSSSPGSGSTTTATTPRSSAGSARPTSPTPAPWASRSTTT